MKLQKLVTIAMAQAKHNARNVRGGDKALARNVRDKDSNYAGTVRDKALRKTVMGLDRAVIIATEQGVYPVSFATAGALSIVSNAAVKNKLNAADAGVMDSLLIRLKPFYVPKLIGILSLLQIAMKKSRRFWRALL